MKQLSLFALIGLLLWASCKKDNARSGAALGAIQINPDTGLATAVVTITGSGFDTTASQDLVTFNGKAAIVQSATPVLLVVTVPDTTTGPVAVSVGSQHVTGPVYTYQTMKIDSVSPTEGPAGTPVTITGIGMTYTGSTQQLQPSVTFNGRPATVSSYSSTRLLVTVPDSAGNGPLVVTLGKLRATVPAFYYLGINSASPLTGNAGTVMTITGGFGPDLTHVKVSIGGVACTITSITTSQIVITVPAGSGSGKISVAIGNQTVPGPAFTYVPPPTITGILPTSGPAGTVVTITGTVFSSIASQDILTFNGVAAPVSQGSGVQLTATVPATATTGAVAVNVNGQPATGPVFTVQSLGIFNVYPNTGPPGTAVTITGAGFNSSPALDQVSFNGTMATVTSASATQLVVTVPAGFTPGTLSVMTGGLTATWPIIFKAKTPGVSTFAGGTLSPGQFSTPTGLAIDANGNVYVADQNLNNIQKITPLGVVSNFAGDPGGSGGFVNAQGTAARFSQPTDLAFDQQGNLYVSDQGNNAIRMIAPDGTVTTFVTLVDQPWGVALDGSGNIYVSDWSGNIDDDYEYSASGSLINTLAMNAGARLEGIVVDPLGNVYTIDRRTNGIFMNTTSIVTGFSTFTDKGICLDHNGNLIVADGGYNQIDLVNPQSPSIQWITGGGGGGGTQSGYQDGPLATALFNNPLGIKVDAQGNIYVADQGNSAIRKIILP